MLICAFALANDSSIPHQGKKKIGKVKLLLPKQIQSDHFSSCFDHKRDPITRKVIASFKSASLRIHPACCLCVAFIYLAASFL